MFFLYRLLAVFGLLVLGATPGAAQAPATVTGHVGSQTCAGCHESEGRAWTGSHHALAWTQPDETTILGDFDDAVFEHKGVTTHFTRHDGFVRLKILLFFNRPAVVGNHRYSAQSIGSLESQIQPDWR